MTDERSIFNAARRLEEPGARRAYLEQTCSGDGELHARVSALLQVHDEQQSFLAAPAAAVDFGADLPAPPEDAGTVVGRYKLLQQIGEGGFGVVFLAEQTRPVRRQVALKIVKAGMDTRQVVARFEAERQALALMDHPHIAKVLDAGATDAGRPYFVMELVRGVPITKYCDEHHLTPGERLGLFVRVCEAVQHAHQKGIIHRDLKPSNVLVALYDGKPVPKVIDFGVAKATGGRLTDRTLFSGFGAMVGTLEYMSPEQAELNQLDVDTRSDVYSLGVLLYELLTGTTPLEGRKLKEAALMEALRVIREEEPPPPSTRLSTTDRLPFIAASRGLESRRLNVMVKGELDWIVMRCLEKDRSRRYQTVNGLARDVERYLSDEPVAACPPSPAYRLRKFARRHRGRLLAVAAAAGALLLGTAVSAWLAVRATRAETLARSRLDAEQAQRLRADAARLEGRRRLLDARLAEAKATRVSRQPGQRFGAWQALGEAAELARELGLDEGYRSILRDEAVASVALPDVRLVGAPREVSPAGQPAATEFDADLRHYARANPQGTVTVHTAVDGSEVARLPVAAPGSLTFSPDGVYLAVQHPAGVRVWDWRRGGTVFDSPAPAYNIAVGFSPDCKLLAIGFRDRTVALYDLPEGTERRRISLAVPPMHVAFHPGGAAVAVAGGFEVNVRDVATGDWLSQLSHPATVHRIAWDEEGALLASTCDDHHVYVWDTTTRAVQMKRPHDGPRRVAFTAGSELLLSWGVDDMTRAWNPQTGRELLRVPGAHGQLSRDGSRLVTHAGGKQTLWELLPSHGYRTLPRRRATDTEHFWEGDISPDGRRLAQGSDQGIRIWDLAGGKELAFLATSRVTSAKFHPSGRALFTSGPGGLQRWPLEEQGGAPGGAPRVLAGPPDRLPVSGFLERVSFDRDAGTLVVADLQAGCRVLDLQHPESPVRTFRHRRATCAPISPDGRWVVSCTHLGAGIKVWDVASGQEVRDLEPDNQAAGVSFSPDGSRLVVSTSAGFTLWDVGRWERVLRIPRDQSYNVGSAAFSRDGRVLAVTLAPSTVDLLDPDTGRRLARLQSLDTGWLSLIGFTPDGSRLAAYGTRDTCVWDLREIGQRLREIGLGWELPALGPAEKDDSQNKTGR